MCVDLYFADLNLELTIQLFFSLSLVIHSYQCFLSYIQYTSEWLRKPFECDTIRFNSIQFDTLWSTVVDVCYFLIIFDRRINAITADDNNTIIIQLNHRHFCFGHNFHFEILIHFIRTNENENQNARIEFKRDSIRRMAFVLKIRPVKCCE